MNKIEPSKGFDLHPHQNMEIDNQTLQKRDAFGVWNFYDPLEIRFSENSKLLAIEVPMQ